MRPHKNTRVQLQRATITRSGTGQEVKVWSTYAEVLASVVGLRGQTYYAAEQTANEIVMELYIWWRSDIEPGDQVVIDGTTYEVAAPAQNIDHAYQETLLRLRVVE